MLGQPSKGSIKLQCTEQAFSEFPNLLVGTQIESGITYFDATLYLHKQEIQKPISDFFIQYRKPIESLCEAYNINPDDACKINEAGHYLIDGNLIYLFISFVEPDFLAYMCDRIHELFMDGITVSDTYLLRSARNRLSKEVIETMTENETSNQ